jgi:glycosyltransferase involved in cell wall biosynthesis
MRFGRTPEVMTETESETQPDQSAEELRQLGDACRDRGMWQEGVRHYRSYLDQTPSDAAIWVQLGHCLKESGLYRDADQAYDHALNLNGNDDDVFLHKGHLAKLMGLSSDAVYFYKKSLALRQDDNDALRELLALGAVEDVSEIMPSYAPPDGAAASTLYFDVSDLIEYATKNRSLSGIQRVVSNLARFSTTATFDRSAKVALVVYDEYARQLFQVRRPLILSMIMHLEESRTDRVVLDKIIQAIFTSRELVSPEAGDMVVIAGAFWVFPGYDLIGRLRTQGVKFAVFIHDLIQIKQPEYVHWEATVEFRKALIDALVLADFVLTNSEFVAGEVREFLDQRLNFSIPVKAVPLSTELPQVSSQRQNIPPEILDIGRDEFVLCVCTIEVRKNHMYLVRIWERLIKEFSGDVPRLVFVGKWGWDIDAFREYLDKSDSVSNWLFIFNDIPDSALDYLYRRCLFTAFVSLAEGWGLPVGESLAHGKPCVASKATSIPEVGGTLARYVDPLDPGEGYTVIKQLISDRSALEQWTQQVRNEFRPRSWRSFSDDFFGAVSGFWFQGAGEIQTSNCLLPSDQLIFGGHDDINRLGNTTRKLVSFRMARAGGWHSMEGWGVWASQRRARLRFRTELGENDEVKLYLLLRLPPDAEGAKCTVSAGAGDAVFDRLTEKAMFCQANGRIKAQGLMEIELLSAGAFQVPDRRDLYIGLIALAFCRSADVLARVALLEEVLQYK